MTDEPSAQNSVTKSGRSKSKEEVSDPCREGKDKNWAHLSHRKPDDGDSETLATNSYNATKPFSAYSSKADHFT